MADNKITNFSALTTPADGDVFPIVDISDTTDASSGTTKKIAVSSFFPSSSTDNAIARFDGITGKLLQDSGVRIRDVSGNNVFIDTPVQSGTGRGIIIAPGVGGTNESAGALYLAGADGVGTATGGSNTLIGGTGGATGAGGPAIVQGGAGGATSGNGGFSALAGGNATAGNGDGGSIFITPGAKSGSGAHGIIWLANHAGVSYSAALDLSLIASSNKTFTFLNSDGAFTTSTSGAGVPTGTAPAAIGLMYIDTSAGKVYVSTGVSAGSDWKILN
jgi:hypothetical protein